MPIGVTPSAEEPAPGAPEPASPAPAQAAQPAAKPPKELSSRWYVRVSEVALVILLTLFASAFFMPALEYGKRLIRLPSMYQEFRDITMVQNTVTDPQSVFFVLTLLIALAVASIAWRRLFGPVSALIVSVGVVALLVWDAGVGALGIGTIVLFGASTVFSLVLLLAYRQADPRDEWILWVLGIIVATVVALFVWMTFIAPSLQGDYPSVPGELQPDIPL